MVVLHDKFVKSRRKVYVTLWLKRMKSETNMGISASSMKFITSNKVKYEAKRYEAPSEQNVTSFTSGIRIFKIAATGIVSGSIDRI